MPEEYGPSFEGLPLFAAAEKGSEPAKPASEGLQTHGTAGVGRRQTFRYISNLPAESGQTLVLSHELGARFVTVAYYNLPEGLLEAVAGKGIEDLICVKTGEVKLSLDGTQTPFQKGEESIIVLTA